MYFLPTVFGMMPKILNSTGDHPYLSRFGRPPNNISANLPQPGASSLNFVFRKSTTWNLIVYSNNNKSFNRQFIHVTVLVFSTFETLWAKL